MACALRDDSALDAASGKSEVADEVEDLVANVFIAEAEGAILRTARPEDDRVLFAGSADEAHIAKLLFVCLVAEGAGWSDEGAVGFGCEVDAGFLSTDGSGEVNGVLNAVTGAWI